MNAFGVKYTHYKYELVVSQQTLKMKLVAAILVAICGFCSGAVPPRSPVYRSAVYATSVGKTPNDQPMGNEHGTHDLSLGAQPRQGSAAANVEPGYVQNPTEPVAPVKNVSQGNVSLQLALFAKSN